MTAGESLFNKAELVFKLKRTKNAVNELSENMKKAVSFLTPGQPRTPKYKNNL
jgi:hypothetical protein